jgi:hypothetical protein
LKKEINFEVINERFNNKVVDGVRFGVEQLQFHSLVIQHVGLSEKAKRRTVEFMITCDWAPIDAATGHLTVGFKIVDKDAVCPISGKHIFREIGNIQAGKLCFPILILIANDNKATSNNYATHFL